MQDTDLDLPDDPPGRRVLGWARDLALVAALGLALMIGFGWARAPSLPDEAPGFTLADLDGQPVSLADLRGRTVVLNFWATWCGPCRMEAPAFASFAEAHPDVAVIGIVADGPPAKVRKVSGELGISYPVLMGEPETFRAYGVDTFPTTVVVAPDGSVRWAHTGLMLRPHLAWVAGKLW